MSAWRRRAQGALPITHHGRIEINNAIALAVFRREKTREEADYAWEWLDNDLEDGNLKQVDILWRAALNRAGELSREHGPGLGTRSLDVLHVSCALELGLRKFFSFDERQRSLASAVGLKTISI